MKLIFLLIESCFALKVYDSNFLNETFWGKSGLHFLKEDLSIELSGSLTFCVRFRFERFDWNSVLWDIRKPNDWVKFFQLRTEYRKTLAYFGNFWGPAQSICTIKDLETEEFNIGDAMVNNNGSINYAFAILKPRNLRFRNFFGLEAWLLSYNKRCSWILKPKEYMDWTKGSS